MLAHVVVKLVKLKNFKFSLFEQPVRIQRSLEITLIAICAALYAALGIATYLGLFTPVIGTVRFWPSVFVPAIFSIAFSPMIGGFGAAIGIFISDMVVHGNPLLSLTVGVPANFLGFYTIGYLYRKLRDEKKIIMLIFSELLLTTLILVALLYFNLLDYSFLFAAIIAIIATALPAILLKGEDRRIVVSGSSGLMLGSAYIGMGVWVFSQFFTLPSGQAYLPGWAALVWFLWTYLTEIPFIAILTPPVVKVLKSSGITFGEEK
jgi:uncharacterized membrane protein